MGLKSRCTESLSQVFSLADCPNKENPPASGVMLAEGLSRRVAGANPTTHVHYPRRWATYRCLKGQVFCVLVCKRRSNNPSLKRPSPTQTRLLLNHRHQLPVAHLAHTLRRGRQVHFRHVSRSRSFRRSCRSFTKGLKIAGHYLTTFSVLPAIRSTSTTVAVPTHCVRQSRPPSSGRPVRPASCPW